MSYIATFNFLGSVYVEASELSLAEACRKAVNLYAWHIAAIAGRELRCRVKAFCLGNKAAWELLRDNAGEHRATIRVVDWEYREYDSLTEAVEKSARIAGIALTKGDTTMRFAYMSKHCSMECKLVTPRFTVEGVNYDAFLPAVREAMTFEYLRMLAEHGMPECTSIGL